VENVGKTKEQLIAELEALRLRVARLEKSEVEREHVEELLRTLFVSSPIGTYVVQDGLFRFVSHQFQQIAGYSENELTGTPPLNLVLPEDRNMVRKNAVKMLKGERSFGYEFRIVTKRAVVKWVMETLTSISYQGRRAALGNLMDVTERKQAEEALRESEEKLRLMFESVTEGITVTNLNGSIEQANEAAVRLHGYDSKEDFIGRSALELITEKDYNRAMASLRKTLEDGHSGTIEYTCLKKDGREFPAELSMAVLRDASGNPAGFVATIRDITELRRMEEQLIITDRLASVGELAAGIAHELNNPLTSVIGFSQLLLGKDMPDDVKEDAKVIYNEALRTAEVVKNLLTFAGKHTPVKQLVNINNIIDKVLELRAYEQKVNNIQVITRFAPDLPEIMADYFQLQQVFLNIIINAEQFMIETHKRGTLTITTENTGNIIRASFTDDGPGIPKENLGHVFDPFFTTKEVGRGTGLGLSICHGIITEHGGRIQGESEPGKGVTFVVELPISVGTVNEGGANEQLQGH